MMLKPKSAVRFLAVGFTLSYVLIIWLLHSLLAPRWLVSLQCYPVLINLGFLVFFASSLFYPPTIIERFARLTEAHLSPQAIRYTRRVTQVWCAFFILNGSIALATILWASPTTWALYNGVIAYGLMALLMAGEYCIRQRVKRAHHVDG